MEGEADGLPTFVSSAVAQRSPLPSPAHAPTQLLDNIAGAWYCSLQVFPYHVYHTELRQIHGLSMFA